MWFVLVVLIMIGCLCCMSILWVKLCILWKLIWFVMLGVRCFIRVESMWGSVCMKVVIRMCFFMVCVRWVV